MDSLTDRLRALALHQDLDVCDKAADRIEALEARLADPVLPFLLGEAEHEGHWFGDDVTPRYWWRDRLRTVVMGRAR